MAAGFTSREIGASPNPGKKESNGTWREPGAHASALKERHHPPHVPDAQSPSGKQLLRGSWARAAMVNRSWGALGAVLLVGVLAAVVDAQTVIPLSVSTATIGTTQSSTGEDAGQRLLLQKSRRISDASLSLPRPKV